MKIRIGDGAKFLAKLSGKVVARYQFFKVQCADDDAKNYEWALRFGGVNIEHLPSKKEITVSWF
ncbi:MAG: hypothetical protein AAFX78_01925 [Cyanobacteria bacterium J06638_20]